MALLAALLVFIPMLIEARRAARNERAQRAGGGIEPSGDVYSIMRVAYPAAFLAMILEGGVRGTPRAAIVATGLVVFSLAKVVKWWAIASLGRFWTFRVIVIPGAKLVQTGPYRYVRHPNYIGVIGELTGVALMTGAWVTGPLATIFFTALIVRRIRIENRALARPV